MQLTCADHEGAQVNRLTRRRVFQAPLKPKVLWTQLDALIRSKYSKAGHGRHPFPLSVMLWVQILQVPYNLNAPGRQETLPDKATFLRFRWLLNANNLGDALLATFNRQLTAQVFGMSTGTMADTSNMAAPTSAKNQSGTCELPLPSAPA